MEDTPGDLLQYLAMLDPDIDENGEEDDSEEFFDEEDESDEVEE